VLTGAVLVVSYDPNNPSSQQVAAMAAMIGQPVNMKFGREGEIQSDTYGVDIETNARYDPRAMMGVMRILEESSPENHVGRIQEAIAELYPNGVPDSLIP
jgi:predicted Zn-dependent protease